jgi:hypothetical protein
MRKDDRLKCLNHRCELSVLSIQTKKHLVYDLVYMLLKMILVSAVATTNVKRLFSAMYLVKYCLLLRNSMGGNLLNHCLVAFIERDVFLKVSEDAIVKTFMGMQTIE